MSGDTCDSSRGRPQRSLHDPYALAGEDVIEHGGELGVAVPDEEPELADPAEEVHDQVAGLLSSPYFVWIVGPRGMHSPVSISLTNSTYIRLRKIVSTVPKPYAALLRWKTV